MIEEWNSEMIITNRSKILKVFEEKIGLFWQIRDVVMSIKGTPNDKEKKRANLCDDRIFKDYYKLTKLY